MKQGNGKHAPRLDMKFIALNKAKRFSITWWTSSRTFIVQGEDNYLNGKKKILLQSCIVRDTERRLISSDKALIILPVTEA